MDQAQEGSDSSTDVFPGGGIVAVKVPERITKVVRKHGIWKFEVQYQDSTVRREQFSSLSNAQLRDLVAASGSTYFTWDTQWINGVPDELQSEGYWSITDKLQTLVPGNDDIEWDGNSFTYYGTDGRENHLCLSTTCGTDAESQCPTVVADFISDELAKLKHCPTETLSHKDGTEYLGRLLQPICEEHPIALDKILASILPLASYDNAFRRFMRGERPLRMGYEGPRDHDSFVH